MYFLLFSLICLHRVSTLECFSFDENDPKACDGAGECTAEDTCTCDQDFYGPNCEEKIVKGGVEPKVRVEIEYEVSALFIPSVVIDCTDIIAENAHLLGNRPKCQFKVEHSTQKSTRLDIHLESDAVIELYDWLGIRLLTDNSKIIQIAVDEYLEPLPKPALSTGAIIGIAVSGTIAGFVLVVIVVATLIFFLVFGKKLLGKKDDKSSVVVKVSEKKSKKTPVKEKRERSEPQLKDIQEGDVDSSSPRINVRKELFKINVHDIEIIDQIGQGGGGGVLYKVRWMNMVVAAKMFNAQSLLGDQTSFAEFEKEVDVLSKCKHIASALDYLHKKDIVHRDVKSDNVLLDENYTSKLIDFGCSRVVPTLGQHMTHHVGTSFYMAPEVARGLLYSEMCDVYSYSILAFEVLTVNFDPFDTKSMTKSGEFFNIEMRVANEPSFRPRFKKSFTKNHKALSTLTKQCWDDNPDLRPDMKTIREYLKLEMEMCELGE